MLYLDDFIEAIETFPEELRDMLTTIRELDLVVQNAVDEHNERAETFFQSARRMKPEKRDSVFESIVMDFKNILGDADEKVNVAERLHNLLLRRLEQLDREIAKFKIDLEADNPGITAVIEQRVPVDNPVPTERPTKKEKKKKSKKNKKKKAEKLPAEPVAEVVPVQNQQRIRLPLVLAPLQSDNNTSSNTVTTIPDANLAYDPRHYCICKQVAYGEMIACDNDQCSYEWFHYGCVNLTTAPEGKWYCPKCKEDNVSSKEN